MLPSVLTKVNCPSSVGNKEVENKEFVSIIENLEETGLTFGQSRASDWLTDVVAVHLAESHIVESCVLVETRDENLLIVHIDVSDAVLAVVNLL